MAGNRQYEHEYKVQAVKLAKEIGQTKAAKELGMNKSNMMNWIKKERKPQTETRENVYIMTMVSRNQRQILGHIVSRDKSSRTLFSRL